ncbi:C-X-C chemokine receptor type 1 [Chanos chanos]|uniref:C-X-C chemokine receptor type 1 n=1 Tax=Chanos chanos TaxID=29144 RepID=A0A6J2WIH8_CHACN|nr:C-X-C chemokine receptor type 1-like [Chanos chanos]
MSDQNISLHLDDFYKEQFNDSNLTSYFDLDHGTLSCEPIPLSEAVNISVCAFYILLILLAVPGNLTVGLVIRLSKHKVLPYDVYLFNLMLADLLMALTLPFSAVAVVRGWLFGDVACKLVSVVKEVNFYSGILFLVCISVDRYKAVLHPRQTRQAGCSVAICVGVWALALVLSLPAIYNESYRPLDEGPEVCTERFHPDSADTWRLAVRVMSHVFGFLLPLVIMLLCYSRTALGLQRTSFPRHRPMRVIVAVVLAFLLCWAPFHVAVGLDTVLRSGLVEYSCDTRTAVNVVMFFTENLGLLHCCVNPVLYAFVVKKYRRSFTQLLQRSGLLRCCTETQGNTSPSQTSDITSSAV